MLSLYGITLVRYCFVLFYIVFVFLLSPKPRPLVRSFSDMHAPTQLPNNCLLRPFVVVVVVSSFLVSLEMSLFPSILLPMIPFFPCMESTSYIFTFLLLFKEKSEHT